MSAWDRVLIWLPLENGFQHFKMRWNIGKNRAGNRSASDGSKTHQIYMNFDEVSHSHTEYHNIMFNNMHFIYLHNIHQSEPMVFLSSPIHTHTHTHSPLPPLPVRCSQFSMTHCDAFHPLSYPWTKQPPQQQQRMQCAYISPVLIKYSI